MAEAGRRVLVPLGRRTETGIVVGPAQPQEEVRDAIRLLDEAPLLTPEIVGLARWAAAHYLAPLGPALKAALPPGMDVRDVLIPRLTDAGRQALVSFTGACAAPARSTDEAGLLTVTVRQRRGGHCRLTAARDGWAPGGRGFRLRAPR